MAAAADEVFANMVAANPGAKVVGEQGPDARASHRKAYLWIAQNFLVVPQSLPPVEIYMRNQGHVSSDSY